ncbi:hypothetical protein V8F20_010912 [Naviculisporaceae sp. PSN 640]
MILTSTARSIVRRLSLLVISSSVLISAKCYYPNGLTALDTPCTDSTEESTCCGPGYACVGHESSFFLCQNTNSSTDDFSGFVRGSCTDKSWRSSNCPNVCVDEYRDNVSGGHSVFFCPDSDVLLYCAREGLGDEACDGGYRLINLVSMFMTMFSGYHSVTPIAGTDVSSSRCQHVFVMFA